MANSQGVVQTNPMNNTHGKHTHNYSSFPDSLAYKHYMTLRFGDYTPSFVMDGEPKDEISLRARHLIDSLSLSAPFKGSIRKITESFMVPKMAILPLNWDRIYTQPANGDDVPLDSNCCISDFPAQVVDRWSILYSLVYSDFANHSGKGFLNGLLRMMLFGEYFFSAGSLLAVCGYHSNNFVEIFAAGKLRSYDAWFDLVISKVFSQIKSFSVRFWDGSGFTHGRSFQGLASSSVSDYPLDSSFRSFLEAVRENPVFMFDSVVYDDSEAAFLASVASMFESSGSDDYVFPDPDTPSVTLRGLIFRLPSPLDPASEDLTDMTQTNCNLSRLLAYQLVCAHYYSNSAIDFIYSAELYRQYIYAWEKIYFENFNTYNKAQHFDWNGIQCPYDYLSGHMIGWPLFAPIDGLTDPDVLFDSSLNSVPATNPLFISFALCSAIFGYRKSLRFGDYFVGSRPRPLAPINTDVSVNNNMVSVIDVTRSIQAQRFANSVMRSRAKIENYVRDLFGKAPAPDYHNPFFLTRQAEIIYGDEVQNTAESQVTSPNSRTALFKSNNGQFLFTFHNDDAHPCVYLQIVSFDVKRAYTRSIDRHFMHRDRYDMFNPDFQYIGDQPVYGYELGYTEDYLTIPAVFGYQGRDMEYKQRFDIASGGFVENLPGWMLTDIDRSKASVGHLDSDFIRSYNSELDQFFLSLNGFSLGSYFHFILVAINDVSAKRAMAVDPQILE